MATVQEDQRTKKVSQGAIDDIRKMGMSAAIKKYTAGEGGAEFKTAVERYYSPQRLKQASRNATQGMVAKSGPSPVAKSTPPADTAPNKKGEVMYQAGGDYDKKLRASAKQDAISRRLKKKESTSDANTQYIA